MNIPSTYPRCTVSDQACPLASRCLHQLAWQHNGDCAESAVPVLNPQRPDLHYATERCTAFREARLYRFAVGMTSLYDNVPVPLRTWVRTEVIGLFPSRRSYFYCRRGYNSHNAVVRIHPDMQQRIAEVFQKCGLVVAPVFDQYVTDYDWV